jgi:manganese/zinc/iron transport system permease protein
MMLSAALQNNPYWGKNFFHVILLFIERMFSACLGKIGMGDLASDEIQICVLALVAIASATVGTFLVMKKMTMLANSLSHTVLLGIVLSYLCLLPFLPKEEMSAHAISVEVLLIASLITGLITTALTQFLTSFFRLQEDASTGLVFTMLFALGIVLITALTRNAHIGTEAIMGNVDSLHLHDLQLIFWIAFSNLFLITILFKEWKVTTFDRGFANSIGFSGPLFNYFLMVLTSVTVIGAFRAVGVFLVLAFLVAPVLTARLFSHRLKHVIFLSIAIGVACSVISVALARHFLSVYHLPLSTSGLTVTSLGALYLLALGLKWGVKCYQRCKPVLSKS